MKFIITMNMPGMKGNPIHQIIAEYPAKDVREMKKVLESQDFLLVEEFYRDFEAERGTESYYSVGDVLLNHRYIGKIRALTNNIHAKNKD